MTVQVFQLKCHKFFLNFPLFVYVYTCVPLFSIKSDMYRVYHEICLKPIEPPDTSKGEGSIV